MGLDQSPGFIRSSAGSALGRLALVKHDFASPDRTGSYRGEIIVAEETRNFRIDLLFADGHVAKRFEVSRADRGERVVFNWDGRLNSRPVDHQLLRVATRGARSAVIFVWAAIAAVRTDKPMSDPIFCTAIGQFRSDDIVQISNETGLWYTQAIPGRIDSAP